MKKRTINAVITKKFNEWVATIDDPIVAGLVESNTICTGGCIASMLLKEQVNDFDFYFRNHATTKAVAEYYVAKFKAAQGAKEHADGRSIAFSVLDDSIGRITIRIKSAGVIGEATKNNYQYFEGANPNLGEAAEYVNDAMQAAQAVAEDAKAKPAYRPVFFSENAITLAGGIQLVIRFYGNPAEIHENYDFVHATNYWTSWDSKVELNQAALESILAKELRYVGSKYPICSLMRVRKFIQRGWSINAGQLLKIAMQVQALDLNDFEVLKEQLTGMDVAYFAEVVAKLKEKNPEKIETAYLVEIIDRMF